MTERRPAAPRTRTRSFRLRGELVDRLEEQARELGASANALAERLLDEGLRMHRHPVITFRVRPSGRRAMLAGTRLDVSDVIAALHDHDGSGEAAARWLDLPAWKVEECVRYYIDHRDEVDAEIREKADRAAEELEAWRRRQEVLGA